MTSCFADFFVAGKMGEMTAGQRSVSWPCWVWTLWLQLGGLGAGLSSPLWPRLWEPRAVRFPTGTAGLSPALKILRKALPLAAEQPRCAAVMFSCRCWWLNVRGLFLAAPLPPLWMRTGRSAESPSPSSGAWPCQGQLCRSKEVW